MSFEPARDRKADINQFIPQKTEPIYEYVYRKFYCEEDVVGNVKTKGLTQLSWNIHTPQEDFVWKSVRLHMPFRIRCKSASQNISMRLADRNPACNVAISASPLKMFTDCQLILNGNMFSIQPNFYQSILDTCYQSRDETSYMSNMSLKPNANRNLRKASESSGMFPALPRVAGEPFQYVQIEDAYSVTSDHAFDLTFANPGYNRRVANFQTDLQGSVGYADTDVISYLDIGPFMNKVRKTVKGNPQYNTAVPFVKDFSLKLMLDQRESEYDRQKGNIYNEQWPGRVLAASLLEYGTPVNMRHPGETELPDHNWAEIFDFELRSKPYLEVCYVKMGNSLLDTYKLRYLDYQYEKSDPFSFSFPAFDASGGTRLKVPAVPVRINSRLLEVASKVYLWTELAHEYKKSYFLGGTQRCCKIDKLHLRINNRNDLLFEPSQEMLFDNFKRLTGNSWGISTWRKCPIYVFDPSTFGLDAFKTGQAQQMHYEWDMEVEPTELLIEELAGLESKRSLKAMGYTDSLGFPLTHADAQALVNKFILPLLDILNAAIYRIYHYQNWIPAPGNTNVNGATVYAAEKRLIPRANRYINKFSASSWFSFQTNREQVRGSYGQNSEQFFQPQIHSHFGYSQREMWNTGLRNVYLKSFIYPAAPMNVNDGEIMQVKRVIAQHCRLDGFAWAVIDTRNNQIQAFNGVRFFYVPESFPFTFSPADLSTPVNDDFDYQPRRWFNRLEHYDLATNAWTAGAPNWATKAGFITGQVTQVDERGTVGTYRFNGTDGVAPGVARGVAPGMRAYHYQTANDAILGILNSGFADAGPHGGHTVNGGFRAQAWGAGLAGEFQYIRQVVGAAGNQEHFKWIAFQLPPTAATGVGNVTGTFLAHDTAGDYNGGGDASGAGRPCGDIAQYFIRADGDRIGGDLGHETHILNIVMERNAFNSQTGGNYVDYGHPVLNPVANYGADPRYGRDFTTSVTALTDNQANSLKFETSVLYEFGQKRYIIEKDGQMLKDEEYPSIEIDRNVTAGVTTFGAKQSVPVLQRSGRLIRQDEFHEQ